MKIIDIMQRAEIPVFEVEGQYGIEVEMEGVRLPMVDTPSWMTTRDGSLRGAESYEYVLKSPVSYDKTGDKLSHLWKHFAKRDSLLKPSNSASIHIHMNMQTASVTETLNTIILYLIYENALVRWCGEHREGNLFCLRARDAENIIDGLEEFARTCDPYAIASDRYRYAALNVRALTKYGSLEFRSMRGVDSPEPILDWLFLLNKIREAAKEFDDPKALVEDYSGEGVEGFASRLFGQKWVDMLRYPGWEEDVWEGMRRCQPIAYAFSGEEGERQGVEKKRFLSQEDNIERERIRELKREVVRHPRRPEGGFINL